jgi:hypothetical protein
MLEIAVLARDLMRRLDGFLLLGVIEPRKLSTDRDIL